jgi:serine/threonine protein kinase
MKIIKNKKAYNTQALIELRILEFLNNEVDKQDLHHIIRLFDHFYYKEHLCIVFELLNENLYELLKQNYFQGISLNSIQFIIKQILEAVYQLQKANLIHCDLKPENILLKIDKEHHRNDIIIKITDFGSSCFKNHTMFDYIQSRYYRAPEVLIGAGYGCEIDMWSIGCIAAELFLGEPIFPGSCEYDQICKICKLLGDIPFSLLRNAKKRKKFFTQDSDKRVRLKTVEEYYKEFPDEMEPKYDIPFDLKTLDELAYKVVNKKPNSGNNINNGQTNNSTNNHIFTEQECFTNFLKGLLTMDPSHRWNAKQALRHPFLTKEKWEGYFNPHQEEISQFHFLEGSYMSESAYGGNYNRYPNQAYMHHSMMNFTNYQPCYTNEASMCNSFMSNPSMDMSMSVYQPCMKNIPLNMLKNFPHAKIGQLNLKPGAKNQGKQGFNKNQFNNNYNNNTFMMTSHDEIFENTSFNSENKNSNGPKRKKFKDDSNIGQGVKNKNKNKFQGYNPKNNNINVNNYKPNQNQSFAKMNSMNNMINMIPGVRLPSGYYSNSNISEMSYDKRFLAEQGKNII